MAILLAANANFVPTSPRQIVDSDLSALRWGMHELNDRLATYGYGGTELHWSDRFRHCRELSDASPEEARYLGRAVISAHEGWVGTSDPIPAENCDIPRRGQSERGSLTTRVGSLLLLPTGAESLDRLEELERKLNRDEHMHYVMFPDPHGRRDADRAKTRRFPNSSIQPTADVEAAWGTSTHEQFIEELTARGYQATLASFHMSRTGKVVDSKIDDWLSLAEELVRQDRAKEVHVEVVRSDFANVDPKRYQSSVQEARALIENGDLDKTPLGDLFALLRDRQWAGNVVIEATYPGLRSAFGKLTPRLMQELHRGLTKGVKQALPHIEWRRFPGTRRQRLGGPRSL